MRVIHQQNGGLSAARNAGLNGAKGQYIAFVDSDDYIYPVFLERLYQAIKKNSADIGICKMISFSNEIPVLKEPAAPPCSFSNTEMCYMLCDYRKAIGIVEACGKLYKREFFDNVQFPIGRVHEDQFVAHKIMYAAKKTVIIDELLYGYFYNPNGITKTFSVKRYDNALALEEAQRFYLENDERELAQKAQELRKLMIAFYTISAKEHKVYHHVPIKYRMWIGLAWREIRLRMGYDWYEWHLAQKAPMIAKIQAKIRRLFRNTSKEEH